MDPAVYTKPDSGKSLNLSNSKNQNYSIPETRAQDQRTEIKIDIKIFYPLTIQELN